MNLNNKKVNSNLRRYKNNLNQDTNQYQNIKRVYCQSNMKQVIKNKINKDSK